MTAARKRRRPASDKTIESIAARHDRRLAGVVDLDDTGRFVCPNHSGDLTISPAADESIDMPNW